jgi:hypothetical protein
MTWELLAEATRNVRDRKRAAGLPEDADGTRYYAGIDELVGIAVGLDLDVDELDAYSRGNAEHGVPYMLAVGPVSALASQRLGGLLDGIEFQRLRDAELRRRNATLVGALETVRRRALDAERFVGIGPVELEHFHTIARIVDTVLEARA